MWDNWQGVAHNFNNALTAISGYAELLTLRLADHKDAREDLGQIQRVAAQAANLTSQLVAFSRNVELQPRALSLNDLVQEVCDLFGPLVSQRIQVRTQLDRSLPPIRCDAAQMEQVIINFLLNARDAMPAGGDITLETNNVLLSELLAFLREHPPLKHGCLRRSLLIRPPLVVRTSMRAAATRPRQCRRSPQTRAE